MSTNSSAQRRCPWLLLALTIALAVTGVILLNQRSPAPAPERPERSPGAPAAAARAPAADASPSSGRPRPPGQGQLPPRGEGRAGDPAIQQALEDSWPADLSPKDETWLAEAGRSLLTADATGAGRDRWPRLFAAGRAPAAFTRFRVQAVIARRATAEEAVVHLVWAGADTGGTYTENRVSQWRFTPTTSNGEPAWQPHR